MKEVGKIDIGGGEFLRVRLDGADNVTIAETDIELSFTDREEIIEKARLLRDDHALWPSA